MTDSERDRLEGKFDEAKGRGKEALGKLAGDKSTELDGKLKEITSRQDR